MFEAHLSAYIAAASVIMATPGPANMLMISRGASSRTEGLMALAGLLAANLMLLLAAILGISSLVLASESAFIALKWMGAAYLFYLGARLLLSGTARHGARPASAKRRAAEGFLTGATNPKALIFYFAFLPQFLAEGTPAQPQLVGLGLVDLALAAVIFGAYALTGSSLMPLMRRAGIRTWLDRCAGGVMLACGAMLLRTARAAG